MGKEENKEMEFWTQDEFQTFLECVADKPISYYAFEMLYWTGIREGELLALMPADFNFEKKIRLLFRKWGYLSGTLCPIVRRRTRDGGFHIRPVC